MTAKASISPNRFSTALKSKRQLAIGLLVLGLVGITGTWQVQQSRQAQLEEAERVSAIAPKITTVTALGYLEPQGELINVTAPTSTQESRISELRVAEGDRVTAGQIIAVLDNRDRLQAALLKAEEQVSIARAQLAQVEAGAKSGEIDAQIAEISRLEADLTGNLAAQQATIARIEAEVNNARADFNRYDTLYQRGGISASEWDARRLTLTTAEQTLAEAEASLNRIQATNQQQISQAKSTLERIREVRPVDVSIAQADIQSAIASVAEAQANLDQAYVKAPTNGQVIEVYTYPGETVGNDGVIALGQTQQMMVVAEVYQDDIGKVSPGQSVEVTSTAFEQSLDGTVERIGLEVQQQQVVSADPSENIDAKVVEVHIRLADEDSKKVANLTNMQVTAAIAVE